MISDEKRESIINNASKVFAEKFKEALKKTHMTQTELATKLDISRTSINSYMKGTLPTVAGLIGISQTLDISIDELLGNKKQIFFYDTDSLNSSLDSSLDSTIYSESYSI